MPADKDAAKRRRQARNRQERAERQARTEGAKRAASRPARTPDAVPDAKRSKTSAKDATDTAPAASPAPGGLLGKLFPPRPAPAAGKDADGGDGDGGAEDGAATRPARPGRPPSPIIEVDAPPGVRGLLLRLTSQPGGKAAVLALVVAVVAAGTLLLTPIAPQAALEGYGRTVVEAQAEVADTDLEEAREEFADGDAVFGTERVLLVDLVPPVVAVIYALVPVLIAGIAVRALLRPTRSRTLLMSSITGVMYVVLTGIIGIYFFLGVLALGFASYQSGKVDRAAMAARR